MRARKEAAKQESLFSARLKALTTAQCAARTSLLTAKLKLFGDVIANGEWKEGLLLHFLVLGLPPAWVNELHANLLFRNLTRVYAAQAAARTTIAARHYLALAETATRLQARRRAVLARRQCRQDFVSLRNAAICMQTALRAYIRNTDACRYLERIRCLQTHISTYLVQKRASSFLQAVGEVQARVHVIQSAR